MSEETTTTATESPETTTSLDGGEVTWENSPIAKVYNPDGTPRDDAAVALTAMGREEIAGHALRNNQDLFTALKTGKDAASFASSKIEGMVKIPTDESTDEERAKFNESLGALDSAEKYLENIWPENLPDDFNKDEGLAKILAEHAAKNPVLNADSTKELASKVIEYQQGQITEIQKNQFEESQKVAESTKNTLTAELGGIVQFEEFSKEARDALTSDDFKKMGFEFEIKDGKLSSANPQQAQLASDPAFLRLLKSHLDLTRPEKIPGEVATGVTSQSADEKARAIFEEFGAGGWKSAEKLAEYNRLRGIS